MIDWNLVPEEIVAIDANADFGAGNFYVLDKKDGELVNYNTDYNSSIGVVLSVRPSAATDIVSVLSKTIEYLREENHMLKDSLESKINKANKREAARLITLSKKQKECIK